MYPICYFMLCHKFKIFSKVNTIIAISSTFSHKIVTCSFSVFAVFLCIFWQIKKGVKACQKILKLTSEVFFQILQLFLTFVSRTFSVSIVCDVWDWATTRSSVCHRISKISKISSNSTSPETVSGSRLMWFLFKLSIAFLLSNIIYYYQLMSQFYQIM